MARSNSSESRRIPYRRRASDRAGHSGHGLGVDFLGGPVVDPTENVKDLTEAAVQRIDDMSELQSQLLDEKILRVERGLEAIEEVATLRDMHAKDARESEAKRLDAIRATDVAAVSTAAAQSLAAIQTLAATATATAETLRNQVTTTATTIANQTDRIVSPMMERLAALEKIVNIGQGRSTVADPQIEQLAVEMRRLMASRDVTSGKIEGMSDGAKMLVAGIGLVLSLLLIGSVLVTVVLFLNRRPEPAIYTPAPFGTQLPSTPPTARPLQ